MIRVPREIQGERFDIRAWRVRDEKVDGFWCSIKKRKTISTDIGQEMAASNMMIRTPSRIDFKQEDEIRLTREGEANYSVDSVDADISKGSESSLRGNPLFIQVLEVS